MRIARSSFQKYIVPASFYTLLMAISFCMTALALSRLPLSASGPKLLLMPNLADPGDDSFFVLSVGQELSHPVFYYDFGKSINYAKEADILLVGNSRTQLGTDEQYLTAEAARMGLRIFNLGFGHGDGIRFALDIIRRHDLRPKIIIANGGPFIFYRDYSKWAREVIAMGAWEARKEVWELKAAWYFQSNLHRFLPKIDYFGDRFTYGWVHYRSEKSGWWRNALEPDAHFPVRVIRGESGVDKRALELAHEFKNELDSRGTLLVLTTVPYHQTHTAHLAWLSAQIGAPYILPSFDGMETADGSHLTRESRRRISKEIWNRLLQLPEVQSRLNTGNE